MRTIILTVCIAVLAVLVQTTANASPVLDQAERVIAQGNPADAIDTLEAYTPTTANEEARQLWALGIAYNRSGQFRAAIAPLNRLVALYPANAAFRLELAVALIGAGQDDRATYHLEVAKGANLPQPVQDRVQAEIDKLAQQKVWQGYFSFAITPESNAARRTAAENISLSGLVFKLLPSAREQPANGVELGFGITALPRITDDLRARFTFSANAKLFDGNAPDDVYVRVGAGVLQFGDFSTQMTAGVFATQRWLDDRDYTSSRGVNLSYARALGTRMYLTGSAEYENLDYVQANYKVHRQAVRAELRYAATAQLVLRAGGWAEHRNSTFAQAAGTLVGVSVGGDYLFTGGLRVGLDVSFENNRYNGRHPLFGVSREDDKWAANIRITNQNWSYRGFAPVLQLGFEEQTSSVILNEYRNLSASIGFTRLF